MSNGVSPLDSDTYLIPCLYRYRYESRFPADLKPFQGQELRGHVRYNPLEQTIEVVAVDGIPNIPGKFSVRENLHQNEQDLHVFVGVKGPPFGKATPNVVAMGDEKRAKMDLAIGAIAEMSASEAAGGRRGWEAMSAVLPPAPLDRGSAPGGNYRHYIVAVAVSSIGVFLIAACTTWIEDSVKYVRGKLRSKL